MQSSSCTANLANSHSSGTTRTRPTPSSTSLTSSTTSPNTGIPISSQVDIQTRPNPTSSMNSLLQTIYLDLVRHLVLSSTPLRKDCRSSYGLFDDKRKCIG